MNKLCFQVTNWYSEDRNCEELGDFNKAIKYYRKSILMKKNADASCNIGYLYYLSVYFPKINT